MGVVAVVGAGFSGVVATRELLRAGWELVLVDPGARPGRGLAYGTSAPWHLLNSPVASMSVDPDEPDDFLRWCRRRDPAIQPSDFVSRAWYGEYITEALQAAEGDLTVHRGRVVRVFAGSGYSVLLANDVVIPAEKVVLAVGNPVPDERFRVSAAAKAHPAYVRDPWQAGALQRLPEGPVMLIGTGLTAVDVALTLARMGRHPRIDAVSRHGLLPQPHAPAGKIQFAADGSLSEVIRAIRAHGGEWRAAMDALRPQWNEIWAGLTRPEQERFLRHVARYWEVHRHRMAPVVAAEIAQLRRAGILTIKRGEVRAVDVAQDGSLNGYQSIVNCTGPGRLIEADPLVRSLIADGLARPGPYQLGLDVNDHGALVGRDGRPGEIYTLGPPRRGRLWETTAAPEIRAQARELADHLIAQRSVTGGEGALGSCRADSAYPLPG